MAKAQRPRPRPRPVRPSTPTWINYWPVGLVGLLILGALVAIYLYARSAPAPPPPNGQASNQVIQTITNLDLNQTAAIGSGGESNHLKPVHAATPLTGTSGHPEVLYVGAEFCPYCAAERWSLVIALSRFGSFSGLQLTESSSTDIYPNTPTLTFAKATYTSSTIDLVAVETADRSGQPLQQPTSAQQSLLHTYDPQGSIPFIDIANRQYEVGAGYLPDNLQGKTWAQVAQALQDPSSPLARQVIGNANWLTAAICQATQDSAGPACTQPAIKTLEGQLGS